MRLLRYTQYLKKMSFMLCLCDRGDLHAALQSVAVIIVLALECVSVSHRSDSIIASLIALWCRSVVSQAIVRLGCAQESGFQLASHMCRKHEHRRNR